MEIFITEIAHCVYFIVSDLLEGNWFIAYAFIQRLNFDDCMSLRILENTFFRCRAQYRGTENDKIKANSYCCFLFWMIIYRKNIMC